MTANDIIRKLNEQNAKEGLIKLKKAFSELRKKGYFARVNFGGTTENGRDKIAEKNPKRFVYFTKSQFKSSKRTNTLNIKWKGLPCEILGALERNNIECEWCGSNNKTIDVHF